MIPPAIGSASTTFRRATGHARFYLLCHCSSSYSAQRAAILLNRRIAARRENSMQRMMSLQRGVGVLAALVVLAGAVPVHAQTGGMERRDDRRDDRSAGRSAKQACKAGDEKSRAECRHEKRDTKPAGARPTRHLRRSQLRRSRRRRRRPHAAGAITARAGAAARLGRLEDRTAQATGRPRKKSPGAVVSPSTAYRYLYPRRHRRGETGQFSNLLAQSRSKRRWTSWE